MVLCTGRPYLCASALNRRYFTGQQPRINQCAQHRRCYTRTGGLDLDHWMVLSADIRRDRCAQSSISLLTCPILFSQSLGISAQLHNLVCSLTQRAPKMEVLSTQRNRQRLRKSGGVNPWICPPRLPTGSLNHSLGFSRSKSRRGSCCYSRRSWIRSLTLLFTKIIRCGLCVSVHCVPLSIAARSVAPLTHATRGCRPLPDGLPHVLYRTFSVRWTAGVHGSQGVRRTLQMETEAFKKTVVHREMTVD
jgi:hypothetical protein